MYDVANVKYSQDMIEALQAEVSRIERIESGEVEPVFKNDLSEWSINKMHSQPIDIVVPDMVETNLWSWYIIDTDITDFLQFLL